MRAMILAAGRGERMRPLTDTIPKPLAPIGKHRLIDFALLALAHAGIKQVVINVCYLADQIINYLNDGSRYGLEICYSKETNGALDSGGGIYQALPLLGTEPFLVLNADVITDFPFASLLQQPLVKEGAHLVLVDNPTFNSQGDFSLDEQHLVSEQGRQLLTFAGISVLHPRLFAGCSPGKFPLRAVLREAIKQHVVTGEHYCGQWHNIGTLEQLEAFVIAQHD